MPKEPAVLIFLTERTIGFVISWQKTFYGNTMDDKLKERLLKISEQIERLYKAEEAYLTLDAVKDHKLAMLTHDAALFFDKNDPKTRYPSESAKATWAKRQPEYLRFRESLAHAEAEFHKQKHLLDLKMKAYDAEHLSYKIENSAIKRGVE